MIDSLLFEYGSFISYITSLHESRIEIEENTVGLVDKNMYILQQKYIILEYSQQFVCLNRTSLLLKIALDSDALISFGNEFHSKPPLYEKDPLQYSVFGVLPSITLCSLFRSLDL